MGQKASTKVIWLSGLLGLIFVVQLGTAQMLFTRKQAGRHGPPILSKAENPEGYWLAQGIILSVSLLGLGLGYRQRQKELAED